MERQGVNVKSDGRRPDAVQRVILSEILYHARYTNDQSFRDTSLFSK